MISLNSTYKNGLYKTIEGAKGAIKKWTRDKLLLDNDWKQFDYYLVHKNEGIQVFIGKNFRNKTN